jgi:hypothetical protein
MAGSKSRGLSAVIVLALAFVIAWAPELWAQLIRLSDGTTASKVVLYNSAGTEGSVSVEGGATEATLATLTRESVFTDRFSAGEAPADNMSNPSTITKVMALNMCWDTSNWDRCQGRIRGNRANSGRISLSNTTETTLIAAGAAGIYHDLTLLMCNNESASEVRVDVRDATSGTVRFSIDLAADGGTGGFSAFEPWSQTTAANNWTVQLSSAVSTVYCHANAIKDQ